MLPKHKAVQTVEQLNCILQSATTSVSFERWAMATVNSLGAMRQCCFLFKIECHHMHLSAAAEKHPQASQSEKDSCNPCSAEALGPCATSLKQLEATKQELCSCNDIIKKYTKLLALNLNNHGTQMPDDGRIGKKITGLS